MLAFFALAIISAAGNAENEEQLEENDTAYNNPSTLEEKSLKFNMEQRVTGAGFYAAYGYALMPDAIGTEGRQFNGVEAKNKAHGSGKIDTNSVIYAESSYTNKTWINGAYDEDGEVIEDEEESTSVVQVKQDNKMVYSPLLIGIGSRYYNLHPVAFSSLLKEEDWIKNRDGLNSLYHRADQAHGINKLLEEQSDATNNTMNIDEDIIDGRVHFGVLQLEGIPVDEEPEEDSEEASVLGTAMKTWKKPQIELDEDYVGSFNIKRRVNLYTSTDEEELEDSWLPCCSGGFSDMNYADAKAFKSARGIFDCTCFNVPDKAQFSR